MLGVVGVVLGVSLGGPERASVRVQSEPSGGQVTLDGAPIAGVTPLVIEDVEHGRHRLLVELEGFARHETSIDVDREVVELRYPLRSVETNARDEAAGANGVEEATRTVVATPSTTVGTPSSAVATPVDSTRTPSNDVDEPSVTTSEMRSTARTRRTERARATTSEEPTPPAGRATISLLTEPWATVRIGGRDYGRTPLFAREVPVERLQIELRARGEGDVVTRTVDAAVGQAVSLRVTLPD